jgi:hypothetical protein
LLAVCIDDGGDGFASLAEAGSTRAGVSEGAGAGAGFEQALKARASEMIDATVNKREWVTMLGSSDADGLPLQQNAPPRRSGKAARPQRP